MLFANLQKKENFQTKFPFHIPPSILFNNLQT